MQVRQERGAGSVERAGPHALRHVPVSALHSLLLLSGPTVLAEPCATSLQYQPYGDGGPDVISVSSQMEWCPFPGVLKGCCIKVIISISQKVHYPIFNKGTVRFFSHSQGLTWSWILKVDSNTVPEYGGNTVHDWEDVRDSYIDTLLGLQALLWSNRCVQWGI